MTTLLCLPGVWPKMNCLQDFEFIIGVDSGADLALEYGITPDLVIGDLDSVNKEKHLDEKLIFVEGQENNDLSKALQLCTEKNLLDICILGFTGKRVDHELANYAALHNANENLDIRVVLDEMIIHRVTNTNDSSYNVPISTTISIFCFEESHVKTSGLKWNIDGEIGFSSKGLSNETTQEEFSISTTGCVFVLIHVS
tara:strand:- start:5784 stop:6377 length:594 start_codon:yes stop_codon:yes gene_type:complete